MNFNAIISEIIYSVEIQSIFRILLAICFGALIGLEREHAHRPAGLRTHILVCLGSCLVMLTSEYIYNRYHQFSPNMDVARLGAQVISGIGFLGAGTIIRNGSSVKGLTTAASIWAVACIGLATGIGYYFGATVATVVIFLCLSYIKRFLTFYDNKKVSLSISASQETISNVITLIEKKLFEHSINVEHLSIKQKDESSSEAFFNLSMNDSVNPTAIFNEIYGLPGIISINVNSKKSTREEE